MFLAVPALVKKNIYVLFRPVQALMIYLDDEFKKNDGFLRQLMDFPILTTFSFLETNFLSLRTPLLSP